MTEKTLSQTPSPLLLVLLSLPSLSTFSRLLIFTGFLLFPCSFFSLSFHFDFISTFSYLLFVFSLVSFQSCRNFFIRNMISFRQTDKLSLVWIETQNIYITKYLTSNYRYLPPKVYNQKFPWHVQPGDEQLCSLPCG